MTAFVVRRLAFACVTLFAVLTLLWITSAAWYFTNVRVGF